MGLLEELYEHLVVRTADRDRYREALERIRDVPHDPTWPEEERRIIHQIIREALEVPNGE